MLRIYTESILESNIEKLIADKENSTESSPIDSQLVDIVHSIRDDMRNDLKEVLSIKW